MGLSGLFKRDRNDPSDNRNILKLRERFFLQKGPLEEPTFLGFKVLFDFAGAYYSPLLNLSKEGAENFESAKIGNQLGFGSGVNIPSPANQESQSLLKDSAEAYLIKNGYADKGGYLRAFVQGLSNLSQNAEWHFKGITGLESAFNFNFTDNKVRGENGESVIEIQLEEDLDMRVTSMLANYYTATRDVQNRRDLLPENMKFFAMTVYIADFRDFVAYDKSLIGGAFANGNFNAGDLLQRVLGKTDIQTIDIPQVAITFNNCYFDPFGWSQVFADLNNGEPSQAQQVLQIRYCGDVEYSIVNLAQNDLIDSKSDASILNDGIKSISDKLGNLASTVGIPDTVADGISSEFQFIGSRLAGQGLGVVNQNIERLRGDIRSQVLGNVYDSNLSTSLQETLLNGAARSLIPGLDRNPFNGE